MYFFQAFLVLFLAFLLVQDCHGSSPTTEEVLSAIKEAKQTNAAKRLTDIHKRARRQSTGMRRAEGWGGKNG